MQMGAANTSSRKRKRGTPDDPASASAAPPEDVTQGPVGDLHAFAQNPAAADDLRFSHSFRLPGIDGPQSRCLLVDDDGLIVGSNIDGCADIRVFARPDFKFVCKLERREMQCLIEHIHASKNVVYVGTLNEVVVFQRQTGAFVNVLRDNSVGSHTFGYTALSWERQSDRVAIVHSNSSRVDLLASDGRLQRQFTVPKGECVARASVCIDGTRGELYVAVGAYFCTKVHVLRESDGAYDGDIDLAEPGRRTYGVARMWVSGKALVVAHMARPLIQVIDTACRRCVAEHMLSDCYILSGAHLHGGYIYAPDHQLGVQVYASPRITLMEHFRNHPTLLHSLSNGAASSPLVALVVEYVCLW